MIHRNVSEAHNQKETHSNMISQLMCDSVMKKNFESAKITHQNTVYELLFRHEACDIIIRTGNKPLTRHYRIQNNEFYQIWYLPMKKTDKRRRMSKDVGFCLLTFRWIRRDGSTYSILIYYFNEYKKKMNNKRQEREQTNINHPSMNCSG